MSQKDIGSKIGLSKLRGKTSNQSVPMISFKFSSNSENITEVSDGEDKTEPIPIPKSSKDSDCSSPEETSSSRSFSRFLGQRSASLDSKDGATEPQNLKGPETPGLFSRLTKTFEHKISEIRSDKNKDAKLPEEPETPKILSSSPSKTKNTFVQDITDHTSKFKSEINRSIRPKISDLRLRKNSKEQSNSKRSSLLNSFWSKEDGIVSEELLQTWEDSSEPIVEAEEAVESFCLRSRDSSPASQNESPPPQPPAQKIQETPSRGCGVIQYVFQKIAFLQVRHFHIFGFLFLSSFFLPIPDIFIGFSWGIACCYALFSFINANDLWDVVFPPKYEETQSPEILTLDIPECEEYHKGWMNKMEDEYCPETYHVSFTQSVFVRLQGASLKIDHPKKRVAKHARHHEDMNSGGFVHHREYDLTDSEVILLPKNLPRRWLWSRKYPICIHLSKPDSLTKTDQSSPVVSFKSDVKNASSANVESISTGFSDQEDLSNGTVDLDSYEEVTADMCTEKTLYLFARSDREKDDWFRRFVNASNYSHRNANIPTPSEATPLTPDKEIPPTSLSESDSESTEDKVPKCPTKSPLDFHQYIAKVLAHTDSSDASISWFNAMLGRILFDFLHNQYWAAKIQERIQRKLSKLHIPYFIGEIIVNGVDLGSTIPQVLSVQAPKSNERGLWVNFEATYSGNFTLSLETKLDLMKIKERSNAAASPESTSTLKEPGVKSPRFEKRGSSEYMLRNVEFDTDTDDSVESSSDEETEEVAAEFTGSAGPSKKLLKIVDTVAASKYFQQASEWRVLQRAMAGVSNTRIELIVEVKRLAGKMSVNIPPPPSDRIWYGFRESPELIMVPRPRLAERAVNFPFLAEFIQKQLRTVFEKVFVEPNMDDIVIPVMSPLLPGQTPPPQPWEAHPPASPQSSRSTTTASEQNPKTLEEE